MITIAIIGILAAMAINQSQLDDRQMRYNARTRIEQAFGSAIAQATKHQRPAAIHPIYDGGDTRIEVFAWEDTNRNGQVDWSDNNGNGVYDDGEGEVAESYSRFVAGGGHSAEARGGMTSFLEYRSDHAAAGIPDVCNDGAVGFGDAAVAIFQPQSGIFIATDERPCTAHLEVFDTDSGAWSEVDVLPSGQMRGGDHDA